jgi:hypothetical protein
VGVEGYGYAGTLFFVSFTDHFTEEYLVPQMHTVKVADGDERVDYGFGDFGKIFIYFHGHNDNHKV